MKKKIIGILVCMLLIVVVFPVVKSVNDSIDAPILQCKNAQLSSLENWIEIQKLLPLDGAQDDGFGNSVSVFGDTTLIGTTYDDDNGANSGSAYVFTRTGSTWTQQAKLLASDGAAGDYLGYSVFLDGDTAFIGADGDDDNGNNAGSAYVFTRTGTTWTQRQKLLASDGAANDGFGRSVSLDGDTVIIGAPFDYDNGVYSGSAYVFTRTGTTWTQQAKLLASDGANDDYFGRSVSLDGDTVIITANGDDDNGADSGSAYVFTRTGSTWTQRQKLLASDGTAQDSFGWDVGLSDNTTLIGAHNDDDNGANSGSAYVFTRTGTTWTQQAKLLASDGAATDNFGGMVSLDGDTVIITAIGDDDNGANSGSAYVFTRTGSTWTQQAKLLASDGAAYDYFGISVSIDGDTVLIGAYGNDDNGNASGSAYVFKKNQPPIFGTPSPANGSIGNSLNFDWSIPINDPDGDLFSWAIQCSNGQTNDGTGATNGTKTLALSNLASLTTYKVWVNATDPTGSGTYTREWYTFTTTQNQPPNKPTIIGPAKAKIKIATNYNFTTTDPNGDDVIYFIEWGDGTDSGWIGPYPSGDVVTKSHTWTKKGVYTLKAKAKDIYGNESDWGQLSVTMPCSYNLPFMQLWERLFERFPNGFPILRHLLGY